MRQRGINFIFIDRLIASDELRANRWQWPTETNRKTMEHTMNLVIVITFIDVLMRQQWLTAPYAHSVRIRTSRCVTHTHQRRHNYVTLSSIHCCAIECKKQPTKNSVCCWCSIRANDIIGASIRITLACCSLAKRIHSHTNIHTHEKKKITKIHKRKKAI